MQFNVKNNIDRDISALTLHSLSLSSFAKLGNVGVV
jgi:hypothetical protein